MYKVPPYQLQPAASAAAAWRAGCGRTVFGSGIPIKWSRALAPRPWCCSYAAAYAHACCSYAAGTWPSGFGTWMPAIVSMRRATVAVSMRMARKKMDVRAEARDAEPTPFPSPIGRHAAAGGGSRRARPIQARSSHRSNAGDIPPPSIERIRNDGCRRLETHWGMMKGGAGPPGRARSTACRRSGGSPPARSAPRAGAPPRRRPSPRPGSAGHRTPVAWAP